MLKMQGDIRVKSKLGRGSNFIVAFPARVAEEVTAFSNVGEKAMTLFLALRRYRGRLTFC